MSLNYDHTSLSEQGYKRSEMIRAADEQERPCVERLDFTQPLLFPNAVGYIAAALEGCIDLRRCPPLTLAFEYNTAIAPNAQDSPLFERRI
jgi:hypothetical protein